ncbi:MAG: hypothetical protein Kow0069_03300 [Promethearchaeota archaeon]
MELSVDYDAELEAHFRSMLRWLAREFEYQLSSSSELEGPSEKVVRELVLATQRVAFQAKGVLEDDDLDEFFEDLASKHGATFEKIGVRLSGFA